MTVSLGHNLALVLTNSLFLHRSPRCVCEEDMAVKKVTSNVARKVTIYGI